MQQAEEALMARKSILIGLPTS